MMKMIMRMVMWGASAGVDLRKSRLASGSDFRRIKKIKAGFGGDCFRLFLDLHESKVIDNRKEARTS